MKVILRDDVEKLGLAGEAVNVRAGYARNFLVPRKLAFVATAGALARIGEEMKQRGRNIEKEKIELTAMAAKINELSVTIPMRVGEEEKLYGSVTGQMVAESLENQGYKIDRRSVVIDEPIRTLGAHSVSVKLKHGVSASIKVNVVAE